MEKYRSETDSMGEIQVPIDAYWGAQTQRSILNFSIGTETMPLPVIHALALIKEACARCNQNDKVLTDTQAKAIIQASQEVQQGQWDSQFPLKVWQTGSGTQTNMNVNEVIANRANEILGSPKGDKTTIHPNDHVNACQSSNDTFPTAMHIAMTKHTSTHLLPSLKKLQASLTKKIQEFEHIIHIGRTHLQDAVPLKLSQSFSAYLTFTTEAINHIESALEHTQKLPIGATAVGTGINAPKHFQKTVTEHLKDISGTAFQICENNFAELSSHNAILNLSGAFNTLATNLNKMANDIRLLGSGPRCGLGELTLPANEPGSSIMPGKVNPTQCEAMTMVCIQVIANHNGISQACASGHFELNAYKPIIIHQALQSSQLLTDSISSFVDHLLTNLSANEEHIKEQVNNSLMLITALKPIIGYDKCAQIAHSAYENQCSLKEAALSLKLVSEEEYDQYVKPEEMI